MARHGHSITVIIETVRILIVPSGNASIQRAACLTLSLLPDVEAAPTAIDGLAQNPLHLLAVVAVAAGTPTVGVGLGGVELVVHQLSHILNSRLLTVNPINFLPYGRSRQQPTHIQPPHLLKIKSALPRRIILPLRRPSHPDRTQRPHGFLARPAVMTLYHLGGVSLRCRKPRHEIVAGLRIKPRLNLSQR